MATITPGSGGTINATTIEGQLWQLIHLINNAERGLSEQRIVTSKSDDFILSGDFTMPAVITFAVGTGVFTESAAPYLPTTTFAVGTGGTITGATLSQYFIDVVKYVIAWQNTPAKNTQALTNVTLSLDFSALEYRGTINLPYTTTIGTGGAIAETATEWLIT